MRSITPLVLSLLLGCFPQNWSKRDTAFEAVSTVLLTADWFQTQAITERCIEANPIIGRCGDRVNPNVYFPLVIVTSMVVTRLLNPDLRTPFQAGLIGVQAATVWDNADDGF